MPVFVMSSNGFLQILDLRIVRLPWLLSFGQSQRGRVLRAVAGPAGYWTLFTVDRSYPDARLLSSWALGRGAVVGLRWRTEGGRSLAALTSVTVLSPDVGRRLLVRIKWPLPESAAFA